MANLPNIEHCETMADVRRNIDALDARIVALIAERGRYVAQAARIKQNADQIVDLDRVESIVAKVRALAREYGAPEEVFDATYRSMIGSFIEFERGEFHRIRQ